MDDRQRRLSRELAFTAFTRADARGLASWAIDRMASVLDERTVRAGEHLYDEGAPADMLYFMSDGKVQLVRDGAPPWTFEGRWVLGSHEVLLERARTRTAVALSDLELVTLPAAAWLELIEDSFDLARTIVENTARGLTAAYARLGDGAFPPPTATLPVPMPAGRLYLVERLILLGEVSLLRDADVQTLTNLAAGAEEVRFAAGAELFARGAPRDRLFVVADGLVEASREDPAVRGEFGPGDLVAGAAALGDQALAWRARALRPTRALALRIELFLDELEEHNEVVRAAMAAMAAERERLLDLLVGRDPGIIFY